MATTPPTYHRLPWPAAADYSINVDGYELPVGYVLHDHVASWSAILVDGWKVCGRTTFRRLKADVAKHFAGPNHG